MDLHFAAATPDDAAALAAMRTRVAEHLTSIHGRGHWSSAIKEAAVVRGMRGSRVLVARCNGDVVGTLALATKKPWAIDPAYFCPARRPLYLVDMAVEPGLQRAGIGRLLLDEARAVARTVPGDAIWLDAYDSPAGAGPFYAKCGFREVGRVTYRQVPLIYFEDRV